MPPIKGNVRGDTKIAGYLMRPYQGDPNTTEMFILSQCDIKVRKLCLVRKIIYSF